MWNSLINTMQLCATRRISKILYVENTLLFLHCIFLFWTETLIRIIFSSFCVILCFKMILHLSLLLFTLSSCLHLSLPPSTFFILSLCLFASPHIFHPLSISLCFFPPLSPSLHLSLPLSTSFILSPGLWLLCGQWEPGDDQLGWSCPALLHAATRGHSTWCFRSHR